MSAISEVISSVQQPVKTGETKNTSKASSTYGKSIGEPQLSEKAAKYYEELKSKFNNMDFILVSRDQKEAAKAQAGKYANAAKMVVLVDEDKIEKMATDKAYREQYEGIIRNAATGLSQLASQIQQKGMPLQGVGMQVHDDGSTSFFAVMDKSFAEQRKSIQKHIEKTREVKLENKKKASKEEAEERLEKLQSKGKEGDTVTITANSQEELLRKIDDFWQQYMADSVKTQQEQALGQSIDFSL